MIVAGGTSGFGFVLSRRLATAGASVLSVGRSNTTVRQAVAACEAAAPDPDRVHGTAADLGRDGEGERVAAEARHRLGGIDALFFCVGRSGRAAMLGTGRSELQASLDANLLTAIDITRATADDICSSRGHFVYIGSLAGKLVTPAMGPYAIAKSALAAFVDAIRLEVEPRGGHTLLVCPGPIRRPDGEAAGLDRYEADLSRHDLPASARGPGGGAPLKLLDPEQLALAILRACEQRRHELVLPRKAAILAGLIEWFPDLGRRLLDRLTRG